MLILLAWISMEVAHAQEETNALETAREALRENNAKQALKHLDSFQESLACPQRIVNKDVLASIWVYRGYAYHLLGKNDSVVLEAWDQAFAMNITIQFDEDVLSTDSKDEQENENILNYFEARRRMAEGFGGLDLRVPEKVGEAKLYVDGRAVAHGEVVHPGLHLAQIVCPADSLQSRWLSFEEEFDWFSMCPSGVDVEQGQEEEDPFFGLGTTSQVVDDVFNPNPICVELETERSWSGAIMENPKTTASLGTGGLLLLGGVYSYYGVTVPRYREIEEARENTGNLTQSQADTLTKEFNTARFVTLGLLGAGLVCSGYGGATALQVTPNWIGWTVSF